MGKFMEENDPAVRRRGLQTEKDVDFSNAASVTLPAVSFAGAQTITADSTQALAVGPNGETNPTFRVDTSVTSAATGLQVRGQAAGSGADLNVISSGTNEFLDINAKGTGEIIFNSTATGRLRTPRSIVSTGATAGIGYATGAGGAVTQATNRTTGVTLNTVSGQITTNTASLAAEATADFTVTNSAVAATDVVAVSYSDSDSGGTVVTISDVSAGSFDIRVHNGNASGGTAETGAIVVNFAVIKAVAA